MRRRTEHSAPHMRADSPWEAASLADSVREATRPVAGDEPQATMEARGARAVARRPVLRGRPAEQLRRAQPPGPAPPSGGRFAVAGRAPGPAPEREARPQPGVSREAPAAVTEREAAAPVAPERPAPLFADEDALVAELEAHLGTDDGHSPWATPPLTDSARAEASGVPAARGSRIAPRPGVGSPASGASSPAIDTRAHAPVVTGATGAPVDGSPTFGRRLEDAFDAAARWVRHHPALAGTATVALLAGACVVGG